MIKLFIFILISLSLLTGCNCPECDSFPEPLRIIYIDDSGSNLLQSGDLEISTIKTCTSLTVDYIVKNYVINGSIEKKHIEITSMNIGCISEPCCAYIHFTNGIVDTMRYQVHEKSTKCCYEYSTELFIYNGVDYTDLKENTIGAFEIIKE